MYYQRYNTAKTCTVKIWKHDLHTFEAEVVFVSLYRCTQHMPHTESGMAILTMFGQNGQSHHYICCSKDLFIIRQQAILLHTLLSTTTLWVHNTSLHYAIVVIMGYWQYSLLQHKNIINSKWKGNCDSELVTLIIGIVLILLTIKPIPMYTYKLQN